VIFQPLNLPPAPLRLRTHEGKQQVFDSCRKKWIIITPEEWVRQHLLHYLITEKQYPQALLAVEKTITLNGLSKRCDIIAFNKRGKGILLVECKAPDVTISQQTFDQIARYNLSLDIDWLLVSNGLTHFCCSMNTAEQRYNFVQEIPMYKSE
jgi:hypothetical protein